MTFPTGVIDIRQYSDEELKTMLDEAREVISWYGFRNARTAVSPERGDMGARTNRRQRLLDRGRGFKPRAENSFTNGKRGHASQ